MSTKLFNVEVLKFLVFLIILEAIPLKEFRWDFQDLILDLWLIYQFFE